MAPPVSSLTCGSCGFVNEAERVYCHNCGTKLDRSILPREEDSKVRESLERTRRRVKKMTNPETALLEREGKTALKVLLGALVVAAIIQIARPPDNVPAANADAGVRVVSADVAAALEVPRPLQLQFTEAELNSYLRSAVRAKAGGGAIPGVSFQRLFTRLDNDVCHFGMQQSLWGYPLYSGIDYKVEMKDGHLVTTLMGGSFGRLRIAPAFMGHLDFAFRGIWSALQRDYDQLGKMQSIKLVKERVVLVTKGVK